MVNANARSTRWPRLLDILAVALVFNLCAAQPVEAAAEPEPPAPVVVMETAFVPGQGDVEPLAKERVKGADVTEHYSSDEWEQELRHQDWMEAVKAVGVYMVKAIEDDPEHVAYIVGQGPLIVQRPYHYADSKSAATYN